jgi:hypothetical protein
MTISSRTPEGTPSCCGVCGNRVNIGVVAAAGDALCPSCGSLLWVGPNRQVGPKDARSRIYSIVEGIEKLSRANVVPGVMLTGFTQGLVHALGANATVIWSLAEQKVEPCHLYSKNGDAMQIVGASWHKRLLRDHAAANPDAPAIANDREDMSVDSRTADSLLILCCFTSPFIPNGVVEVSQRKDTPPQARPGFLMFVEQMVKTLRTSVAMSTQT